MKSVAGRSQMKNKPNCQYKIVIFKNLAGLRVPAFVFFRIRYD